MLKQLHLSAYRMAKRALHRTGFRRSDGAYEAAEIFLGHDVAGVIDGGTFAGTHSLYFAKTFPRAKIYAFEPTPSTFRTLPRMVEHGPRIRPCRVALADQNGSASINNNVLASTNSLLESGRAPDAADMCLGRGDVLSRTTIETVALDDFAARKMKHCDFLTKARFAGI